MEIAKFFLTFSAAAGTWFVFSEYVNVPFSGGLGIILGMSVLAIGFRYKWFDVNKM